LVQGKCGCIVGVMLNSTLKGRKIRIVMVGGLNSTLIKRIQRINADHWTVIAKNEAIPENDSRNWRSSRLIKF
jgi:hypothetical protein